MEMQHKVAFITGGAQGLGRAFAEAVLDHGGKVCFGDINASLGRETEQELRAQYGDQRVLYQYLDVTNHQQFEDVVKAAVEHFGQLDIFVNNAGISNESKWIEVIDVNLTAVIWGTKLAINYMSRVHGGKGGVVVNIGSTSGLTAVGFVPTYSATKHGVVGFTRSIAANLRESGEDHGLRCCCLCPSFANTPLFLTERPGHLEGAAAEASRAASIKSTGIVQPSDVARGFLELVTNDQNDGAVLTVTPKGLSYRHPRTLKPKL